MPADVQNDVDNLVKHHTVHSINMPKLGQAGWKQQVTFMVRT